MPKPKTNETRSQFIGRCMSDEEARGDFPSRAQRYAFCNSVWEQSKKKKSEKAEKDDSTRSSSQ